MNYYEAKTLVTALNREIPSWYCPLTRERCRSDCYCFRPAALVEDQADKFSLEAEVSPPGCKASILNLKE